MQKLLSVILLLPLAACVKPPIQTGSLQSGSSVNALGDQIYTQAQSCWTKKANMWNDGIETDKETNASSIKITAHRYAMDIGHRPPFIIVTLNDTGGKTNVDIMEGEEFMSLKNTYTSDVKNWVNGNNSCSEK